MDYQELIDTISSVDLRKLHELYLKRRGSFVDDIRDEQHEFVQQKLVHATLSTDLCWRTFTDLLLTVQQSAEQKAQAQVEISQKSQSTMDTIINEMEALSTEVTLKNKHDMDNSYKQMVKIRQAVIEYRFKKETELNDILWFVNYFSLYTSTLSYITTYESLRQMLSTTDLTTASNIALATVKNLIGLVPFVGQGVTVLWDMYEAATKKSKQLEETSNSLTRLDNYISSTLDWCVVVQVLIELEAETLQIKGEQVSDLEIDLSDEQVQLISEKVHDRFKDLVMQASTSREH